MTEDFVYEDDPRLAHPETVSIGNGEYILVRPRAASLIQPWLLYRSGGSLKLLEVRKRPKPLEKGQKWREKYQERVLLVDLHGYWYSFDPRCHWLINERYNSPEEALGLKRGQDPRDHGWALLE